MKSSQIKSSRLGSTAVPVVVGALLALAPAAQADVITDWNIKANEIVIESRLGTPPAIRVMAIVQTAVHEAVQATWRSASVDAAVAAAQRATLLKLLPAQQPSIDKAYEQALAAIADGPAKRAGIAAGEAAAARVFEQRAKDTIAPESYRPFTVPGAYVPTAAVAAPTWSTRQPWVLRTPSQFRVVAPPALTSEGWARSFNEVKSVGSRASTERSAEQTEIARFWEYSLPAIYHGVVRSVASQPGRDVARNARLFAVVAQAMDDGMIAVLDSKYHYNLWRPVTAIRNGDVDGSDATVRDASWASLIESPLHPEYPSAHATLASAVAAVLRADVGHGPLALSTTSPTAKGATRRWDSLDAFMHEVAESRIYAGIHYRFSTDAGLTLGTRVGELAAQRLRGD